MFISIPKDFFVPVLFSDEFRYNSEDDAMEYDTEESLSKQNINRKRLQNLDFTREEVGSTTEYMKNIININDKKIEQQIINYSNAFIKFLDELKRAKCISVSDANINNLINYYANGFRNLHDEYKNLMVDVVMPIASSDEDGIIDKFIGELENLYNKNIAALDCKNLDMNTVEATINEISDNAREIIKEEIRNINCEIVNERTSNKTAEEVKTAFDNGDKIYKMIDREFAMKMVNKLSE